MLRCDPDEKRRPSFEELKTILKPMWNTKKSNESS
jgi:hypothetical protein